MYGYLCKLWKPKRENVLKAALHTNMMDEIVEIGLGVTIAIPTAFAMFGASFVHGIAQEAAFRMGFLSIPAILLTLPFGNFMSFTWLFSASLTSSLALGQPVIAFFEEGGVGSIKNSPNHNGLGLNRKNFVSLCASVHW